jgi:hypothetical protein
MTHLQRITNLVETNVGGLLTEALTADVHLKSRKYPISNLSHKTHSSSIFISHIQISNKGNRFTYTVLADQTSAVGADTAIEFVNIHLDLPIPNPRSHIPGTDIDMIKRTIDGNPCRTCGGGCTRRTRESS